MVLPIYKVLSLVIRVFSKPLVTYTKQIHLKNDASKLSPFIRKGFINLGNAYNKGQSYINRKFMNIQSQFAYKPLNDELAIEKGIQFFYEIIFYSLVIGLPLYQMNRASNQAKAKSQALDAKLKKIDEQLQQILKRQTQLDKQQATIKSIPSEKPAEPSQPQQKNPTPQQTLQQTTIPKPITITPKDGKTHIYHISLIKNTTNPQTAT